MPDLTDLNPEAGVSPALMTLAREWSAALAAADLMPEGDDKDAMIALADDLETRVARIIPTTVADVLLQLVLVDAGAGGAMTTAQAVLAASARRMLGLPLA